MTEDLEALARKWIEEDIAVKQALLRDPEIVRLILSIARDITESLNGGRKLFLIGNGGSAADAEHLAAEFVGRYKLERRALPVIALSGNTSSLTAISNDYSFDAVFARQLEAFGASGDIVIGFSTSGNSRNVIKAFETARRMGIKTIGITGPSGRIREIAERVVCVPSSNTPRIQECHILIGHMISEIVEQALFGAA